MADCTCNNFPASLTINTSLGIGVGTTAPAIPLQVQGTSTAEVALLQASTTNDRARLVLVNANTSANGDRSSAVLFQGYNAAGTTLQNRFELGTDLAINATNDFYIVDGLTGAVRCYIGPTGLVGIGTTAPIGSLAVQADNLGDVSRAEQLALQGKTNANLKLYLGIHTEASPAYASLDLVEEGWRGGT